jgi:hypothetical protein
MQLCVCSLSIVHFLFSPAQLLWPSYAPLGCAASELSRAGKYRSVMAFWPFTLSSTCSAGQHLLFCCSFFIPGPCRLTHGPLLCFFLFLDRRCQHAAHYCPLFHCFDPRGSVRRTWHSYPTYSHCYFTAAAHGHRVAL